MHSTSARSDEGARTHNSFIRLLNWILGRSVDDLPKLIPGLLLAAGVVIVSVLVADYVNSNLPYKGLLSYIMTAIVIGLVIGNTITIPDTFAPGVSFCLTKLLRLGIIMMGIRLRSLMRHASVCGVSPSF